jgi:acetate kinase
MNRAILVLNSGSSSVKFAVYQDTEDLPCLWRGMVESIATDDARMLARSETGQQIDRGINAPDHDSALNILLDWLEETLAESTIHAAGHRVVHGGMNYSEPVRLTPDRLQDLQKLCSLAPLHQPHNLHGIEVLTRLRSELPQVACFDTAFHRNMPEEAQLFALPREITEAGVRRYGFHGLSYEYIADVLPEYLGAAADGRVVVAHLGHGASLCALKQRSSIATTMSFSPLDGVPMATRSGSIDPSVVFYLQQTMGMSLDDVTQLLNHRAGLLGVSGISNDMRELLESTNPHARMAVDLFVYQVIRAIGSLAAALGGLDALVFTAGIGENAATIRKMICHGCSWFGLELDLQANTQHGPRISLPDSTVSAWAIATNEELMIARHTSRLVTEGSST